jgi:hypothetical protein
MRVKLIKQKELGDYYLILEGKIYHTNTLFYKRHGVSKASKKQWSCINQQKLMLRL